MQIEDARRRTLGLTPPPIDRAALALRLPHIRELSTAHREQIMAACEPQRLRQGSLLCQDRSEHSWAYYLLHGTLIVTGADRVVRELDASTQGMLECFHAPGNFGVHARAKTEISILRIPVATLNRYINLTQASAAALPDVIELGADDHENADGLELALSIGVLSRLPPANIQRLLQRVEEITVRAGDIVLEQGARADSCYIIKSGVAEVDIERNGGTIFRVALKGPGEFFGEEALLARATRRATVRMRADGQLLRIDEEDFQRLVAPVYIKSVTRDAAESLVSDGAVWLDMREPSEFQHGSMPGALNIPEAILRLRCTSLDPKNQYIVCSGDPAHSALGNFMLTAAGLEAYYLDEAIGALEATSKIPFASQLESDAELPPEILQLDGEDELAETPAISSTAISAVDTDAMRIGIEDIRAAERQRYQRRLRKSMARIIREADARVRTAVQEVEMSYLAELENKHRQVLDLKRKVAQQQREIWKLQQAAVRVASPPEPAQPWSNEVSPDSI